MHEASEEQQRVLPDVFPLVSHVQLQPHGVRESSLRYSFVVKFDFISVQDCRETCLREFQRHDHRPSSRRGTR